MASLKLDGTDEVLRLLGNLRDIDARQLPFATSLALNKLLDKVWAGELSVMKARFDRPTQFTMNSLKRSYSTKTKLEATVKVRDEAGGKAVAPIQWLMPEAEGGERSQKKSEVLLSRTGLGKYWTPAAGAQLDGFGNVSRGMMVKMLSSLRAFGQQGYMANRTRSKRSQRNASKFPLFVGAPEGERAGVWQRVELGHGTGLKPLMWLHDSAPKYRVRIPFEKIAANIYKAHAPKVFQSAIVEALRTAH